MAAEVSSKVQYHVLPSIDKKVAVFAYTKTNTTDYLTLTNYGFKTILYAIATDLTAGADDPCTWSGAVLTFSAGTGTGKCLVVGSS